MTISLVLWTDDRRKRQACPVYLVVRSRGARRTLSTGVQVRPQEWNARGQRVTRRHPAADALNALLNQKKATAYKVYYEAGATGNVLSAEALIEQLRMPKVLPEPQKRSLDLIAYFDRLLDHYSKLGQISTARAYHSGVRALEVYTKRCTRRKRLSVAQFDVAFMRGFVGYLVSDRQMKANTVHKYVGGIRTLYLRAQEDGAIDHTLNPFRGIKLKKERVIKPKLTLEQVRLLGQAEVETGSWEERAQDAFIFAFSAGGMRFGDVAKLRRESLILEPYEGRERYTVFYVMQKTGMCHRICLNPFAERIAARLMARGGQPMDYLFPFLKASKDYSPAQLKGAISAATVQVNKALKRLAQRQGIPVAVTTHLARHSFAAHLEREGLPLETIKEVMAHRSIRSTKTYVAGIPSQRRFEYTANLPL